MEIKVYGSGCPNCQKLKALAEEAVEELGLQETVWYFKDINKMVEDGITITPALVIGDEIKASGKLPTKEQIISWLQE